MPQFFKQQHYDAFEDPKPQNDTQQERDERGRVQGRLLDLHDLLWPFITKQGWDLHRHYNRMNYVSSICFSSMVPKIEWVWLHYGKSKKQITFASSQDKSFYMHLRIQFYLNIKNFGVWLIFTNSDFCDKKIFLEKLRTDQSFQNKYWDSIQTLLNQGFNYVNEKTLYPLNSGSTQKGLIDFIKGSSVIGYSGINKKYDPKDPLISEENIVSEMEKNLKLLYPLYAMMAYRPKPIPKKPVTSYSSISQGGARITKLKIK